jgi:hypothetical protein
MSDKKITVPIIDVYWQGPYTLENIDSTQNADCHILKIRIHVQCLVWIPL